VTAEAGYGFDVGLNSRPPDRIVAGEAYYNGKAAVHVGGLLAESIAAGKLPGRAGF
jgi:hypothetical protein